MKSVLFLIPTLDRGGAENVLVDLVNNMDQSRFEITVQTLFDKDSQKDRLRKGIQYRTFLFHQFHGNSRLFARIPAQLLYKVIVRKRYDVVISYLEGPTTHIISGCPFADSRKAAWVHVEMNNERQLSVGFHSGKAAFRAYQEMDKVVFVAKTVKDSFLKVYGSGFINACILYNTIDSQKIRKKSLDDSAVKVFSEKEINIISVGRVIAAKGYDRLARIQKKLRNAGYCTHIYILGTGKEQKDIERFVSENGLDNTFTFLGFQANPYSFISKADLFVCSSRREGFSTAVTEALVLGIPVVSTDCSGARELLGENDEYGIIAENNEEALYESILKVLKDPKLLEYYRIQAAARGKYFSKENTVKAVEEMILSL